MTRTDEVFGTRRVIEFYQVPDDLEAGVAVRMERQHILYHGVHRFHFILAEQALKTQVGDTRVMAGQLDRLVTALALPRVRLGILPAEHQHQVPSNQFILFDDRLVHVEAITAELAITQPREIALYAQGVRGPGSSGGVRAESQGLGDWGVAALAGMTVLDHGNAFPGAGFLVESGRPVLYCSGQRVPARRVMVGGYRGRSGQFG
ncbi:Scr1 family TA system antitoxin-like transcriptional regulator [Plantactinospora sp. B5E13]|uniref:Scr1 family TA system antitoxin-like transcriptional regulator n=1 Tax=Plantactinospora sp. B5E13 TaxID=3153758 RepID=UPI00325E0710